ncbi:hypothetical protein KHP57_07910 [Algiphilus sp. NNCM1]|nr:hypothetical protein [Algiphilus acroporae]
MLTAESERSDVRGHLAELAEPTDGLDLAGARRLATRGAFEPVPVAGINRGFTEQPYWYRISLRVPSQNVAQRRILEVEPPWLDKVDLYLFDDASGGVTHIRGGTRRPHDPRLLQHRMVAMPIEVEAGATKELLIRVQTTGPHAVALNIESWPAFYARTTRQQFWYGGFYGVLGVMLVYNLIIGAWVRQRAYLYYVLYTLAVGLMAALMLGHARQLVGMEAPGALLRFQDALPVSLLFAHLFQGLFVRELLSTRTHAPMIDRVLVLFILVAVFTLPLFAVLPHSEFGKLVTIQNLLGSGAALYAGVVLSRRGIRAAHFYVIAVGGMLLTTSIAQAAALGLLPANFFTQNAWQVGACFDLAVLSLALADRVNSERRERERLVAERRNLVQDLHDGVGGQLVNALALAERGSADVSSLPDTLRDAMNELRWAMDLAGPREADLLMMLFSFRERYSARLRDQGLAVDWFFEDALANLPPMDAARSIDIIRILQEAFANIVKHSQARCANVRVSWEGDELSMAVSDDGVGIPPSPPHGRGLANIQERAERLGGKLTLQGGQHGSTVSLRIPVGQPSPRG